MWYDLHVLCYENIFLAMYWITRVNSLFIHIISTFAMKLFTGWKLCKITRIDCFCHFCTNDVGQKNSIFSHYIVIKMFHQKKRFSQANSTMVCIVINATRLQLTLEHIDNGYSAEMLCENNLHVKFIILTLFIVQKRTKWHIKIVIECCFCAFTPARWGTKAQKWI